MKYVDRDNFRRLTGLGRDMAQFIDDAISGGIDDVNAAFDGRCDVYVERREYDGIVRASTIPWPIDTSTNDCYPMLIIALVDAVGAVDIITLHLFLISRTWNATKKYCLYVHSLFDPSHPDKSLMYAGITKRDWRTRWTEHLRSAKNQSHYLFHEAIRQHYGKPGSVTRHMIFLHNMSENEALKEEEKYVAEHTLYPLGLNMVPGGNAGLAYLRHIGAIGNHERVAPDDRQDVINRFFERTSRKGLPNPLAAANWLNADYAEKVMCAGDDRLKPQQIRDARFLSSLGHAADEIAARVGARNIAQIQRLIAGETYSRII